jgi:adenylate kinase
LRVVLLGLPGSGKGTQAEVLSASAAVPHISTGDLFRQQLREMTQLGRLARTFMDRGENVPDDVTIAMVRQRLSQPDVAAGFVLDGFPRTLPQAEALDGMLAQLGTPVEVALLLRVDVETVVRRLSGRRVCSKDGAIYHIDSHPPKQAGVCDLCGAALIQRDDDREDVARHRIQVQWAQAQPLLPYYSAQGKLVEVGGDGPVEVVAARVAAALGLPRG